MKTKRIENSKASVWYGLHMYPGLAEYRNDKDEPYRVYLDEPMLRKMDPTFSGRPVYVQDHPESVEQDLNELRKESDGWVVDSFFNEADGKHWVKFVVCSTKAEEAIKNGYALSNCYAYDSEENPGEHNAVSYQRRVVNAEYEHLAIVSNPRYEESVILSPADFKKYCEEKKLEVAKISNMKGKEMSQKKTGVFSFFTRTKVENSAELANHVVVLPKSNKEVSIERLINEADEREVAGNELDLETIIKTDDLGDISIADLLKKVKELSEELAALKSDDAGDEDESDEDKSENEDYEDEDEAAAKEEAEAKEKKAKEEAKASNSKAASLRKAGKRTKSDVAENAVVIESGTALGKVRYGS